MTDNNRRRGGAAAARSHQHYLDQLSASAGGSASSTPTHQRQQQQQFAGYQQQQQSPYQYQQQQKKAPSFQPSRSAGYRNAGRGNAPQKANSSAKMGIKSGMTVEDLKRLTQKRMQQSGGPATPTNMRSSGTEGSLSSSAGPSSRPATPKLNMTVVNATSSPAPGSVATPPVIPKTGMSVQELKQLTSMRLASQGAATRPSDVTGLVSKAVLTHAAKSHYRDSLRGSLTPGSTPKRGGGHVRSVSSSHFSLSHQTPGSSDLSRSHGPMGSNTSDVIPVRGHRSRSRSSQMATSVEPAALDAMPLRYSYAGGQAPEDFARLDFGHSTASHETDAGRASYDEASSAASRDALQFPEDSFPPPPPMDDSGGFVATALPSWSPPPARTKKLVTAAGASGASPAPSFYSQQTSYYSIASKDEASSNASGGGGAASDQNAMLAPPPGLSRRPSMTVPWQVAEAVLNTPQTSSGRKKLAPSADDADAVAAGLKSPAAEAAAQLSALSMPPPRSRSGSGAPPPPPPPPPTSTALGSTPPANAARRGSFGNAAEFFKFRRRSKSRLELARDLSYADNGAVSVGVSVSESGGGFPSYGTAGSLMPGIAERQSEAADAGRHSGASSSASDKDESSSQEYTDEELVQVTGGYDDTSEISSSFVSFYQAARQQGSAAGAPSALAIPPPPPPPGPPPMDDEDAASSSSSAQGGSGSGLPMMSPNGARLRKVAELARRGSLSSEDKTRAKDEIIQSSLGLGASNAARLLAAKQDERGERVPATSPPGLSPPRATSKAAKTLAPGAGIVRGGGAITQEDLAAAAQKVADCVSRGDMTAFNTAMDELAWMRSEASKTMRA